MSQQSLIDRPFLFQALFAKIPSETMRNLLSEAQLRATGSGLERKRSRKADRHGVSKPVTVPMLHTLEEYSRQHFYIELLKKTKSKASSLIKPVWMCSKVLHVSVVERITSTVSLLLTRNLFGLLC